MANCEVGNLVLILDAKLLLVASSWQSVANVVALFVNVGLLCQTETLCTILFVSNRVCGALVELVMILELLSIFLTVHGRASLVEIGV